MTELVRKLVPAFDPDWHKIGIMTPSIHLAEIVAGMLHLPRREWFYVHDGASHWYGLRDVLFLLYGKCWKRSDWDCFHNYWHYHMPPDCGTFFLQESDLREQHELAE